MNDITCILPKIPTEVRAKLATEIVDNAKIFTDEELFIMWQYAKCNPVYFIDNFVWTFNPHNFPPRQKLLIKPYQQFIIESWVKEPFLLIDKPRQMLITWIIVALFVWDCIFHEGRFTIFQSRKQDDAGSIKLPLTLLSRAKFIVDNLPARIRPTYDICQEPPSMVFPITQSTIFCVSMTADSPRQYTITGIFSDEMAFQEDAAKAYAAVLPALQGGGRFIGVSSANGKSFFYKLCHESGEKLDYRTPMRGVNVWRNEKNKIFVIDLHYYADLEKDSEKWVEKTKQGYLNEMWLQEILKSTTVYSGQRIFNAFDRTKHVQKLKYMPDTPLLRGWDPSFRRQAVVFTQIDSHGRLMVLKSILAKEMPIQEFAELVIEKTKEWFPDIKEIRDFGDPSGHQSSITNDNTAYEILLNTYNIYVMSKKSSPTRRIEIISQRLNTIIENYAGLIVDEDCIDMIEGFDGGFCYPDDKEGKGIRNNPRDEGYYIHLLDALGYIVDNLFNPFGELWGKESPEDAYYRNLLQQQVLI